MMNLHSLFQNFNPSKFVVYSCLLVFTLLLSLRLDNRIQWSYWAVFAPLWFWKCMVLLGAFVGALQWWRHPQYRVDRDGYIQFKAMLVCVLLHLLILVFELLVCDKLETGRHMWIIVFVPLVFISIVSIVVCIWAVKHDRSFELEIFCSVNILQFIFLALRLDLFVTWSWVVVFVPLWVVMCLALIGVLYAVIFAGILLRTTEVSPEQRRNSINSAFAYSFLVVPMLIFLVLLTNKLDGDETFTYFSVCTPIMISFSTLVCMSFSSRGGNHWWFGMRKDFCHFLLSVCPCLQEYGNISYNIHGDGSRSSGASVRQDDSAGRPVSVHEPMRGATGDRRDTKTHKHIMKDNSKRASSAGGELKVVPKLCIDIPD